MEKSLHMEKLRLGVCYYPEHWPEELWENDLKRMQDYGIEVVRIAEFAWNKFELEEGTFTYDFFDRFVTLANKIGMKMIFCTPSATPPAWLTKKYPEVLNAKKDGTVFRHGMRRHYNYNSPIYRKLVSAIVERLAAHYCLNEAIIGWQIDNELNCELDEFYSESDHTAFREYLKEKFGTLAALNKAMGTIFWNQTYTSWDQIFLTRSMIHKGGNNPHMALEEKRFFSHSAISFCKIQADIIRKYAPKGQFITTNGIFNHLDSHEMTDTVLDFITYDSYPDFGFDYETDPQSNGNLKDRYWSCHLSKVRSISPNFGIMEQQSGAGGWDFRMKQPMPKPGQMRLWTYQSVAHGADYISYFRWRTCWVGTEIYWHGLNDYSNMPNRRLGELERIRDEFQKLSCIAGSRYKAEIAFLKDYDNEWDGEQDQWHGPLDRFSAQGWFIAAQRNHTPMDYVYLTSSRMTTVDDLKKYKLLIYPHATILTRQTADLLKSYVEQGGQLIMGARTGYKDEFGRCPMRIMPGFASEICGVTVSDYTSLGPADDMEYAIWDEEMIEAPIFNDILEVRQGAEVLARFKGSYYNGLPALICNRIGNGKAYYFGAGFTARAAALFLKKLGLREPYGDIIRLPEEAELSIRSKNGKDYMFVLNYQPQKIKIALKIPATDLLTGNKVSGEEELYDYGVAVLVR
ncbi:MAG TPA: beta-galactosidase [Firmicutes bacterium]|nr:beta-galactosidase [Bacillota bacterium]